MNRVREHLLADAGLALDQDVDAAPGDLLDERRYALDRGILDDQAIAAAAIRGRFSRLRIDDEERERSDLKRLAVGERDRLAAADDASRQSHTVRRAKV